MNIGSRTFRLVISFLHGRARLCPDIWSGGATEGWHQRTLFCSGREPDNFPWLPDSGRISIVIFGDRSFLSAKGDLHYLGIFLCRPNRAHEKGRERRKGSDPFMLEGTIPYPDNSRHFILIDIGNPCLDFRSVPSLFIAPDYNLRGSC